MKRTNVSSRPNIPYERSHTLILSHLATYRFNHIISYTWKMDYYYRSLLLVHDQLCTPKNNQSSYGSWYPYYFINEKKKKLSSTVKTIPEPSVDQQ